MREIIPPVMLILSVVFALIAVQHMNKINRASHIMLNKMGPESRVRWVDRVSRHASRARVFLFLGFTTAAGAWYAATL